MQDLVAITTRRDNLLAFNPSYGYDGLKVSFAMSYGSSKGNLLGTGSMHGIYIYALIDFSVFATDSSANRMVFGSLVVILSDDR